MKNKIKKFIFWKLENNKKKDIVAIYSDLTKKEIKKQYRNYINFDGVDTVNC